MRIHGLVIHTVDLIGGTMNNPPLKNLQCVNNTLTNNLQIEC